MSVKISKPITSDWSIHHKPVNLCKLEDKTIVKLINTTDIGYNILLAKFPNFNAEKTWPESAI